MASTPLPVHVGSHGCQMAGYLYPVLLSSRSLSLYSASLFAGLSPETLSSEDHLSPQEQLHYWSTLLGPGGVGHSQDSAWCTPGNSRLEEADLSSFPLSSSFLSDRDFPRGCRESRHFFARCLLVNDDSRSLKTLTTETGSLFSPDFCVAGPSHSPALPSDHQLFPCAEQNSVVDGSLKREAIDSYDSYHETPLNAGTSREKQINSALLRKSNNTSGSSAVMPQRISRLLWTRSFHKSSDTFAASYFGSSFRKQRSLPYPGCRRSSFSIQGKNTRRTEAAVAQASTDKRPEGVTNARLARHDTGPHELPTLLESHTSYTKVENNLACQGDSSKPQKDPVFTDRRKCRQTHLPAGDKCYRGNDLRPRGTPVQTGEPHDAPGRASVHSGQLCERAQQHTIMTNVEKSLTYEISEYSQSASARDQESLCRNAWKEKERASPSVGRTPVVSFATLEGFEATRTAYESEVCGLEREKPPLLKSTLEKIRRQLERHDGNWKCSGFLLLSNTSEGGGSGLVGKLLEELRDLYCTAPIGVVALWPPRVQMDCVAKYNLLLHAAWTQALADALFVMDSETIMWDLQNVVPGLATHIRSSCPRNNIRLSRLPCTRMTPGSRFSLHGTCGESNSREAGYSTLQSSSSSSFSKPRPSTLQQVPLCPAKPSSVSSDDIQAHAALCIAHILTRSHALPDSRPTRSDEDGMADISRSSSVRVDNSQGEDFVSLLSEIAPSPALKLATLDCTYTVPGWSNFPGSDSVFPSGCQRSARPASGLQQLARQTEKLLRQRLRKASESRAAALSFVGRANSDEKCVGRQAGPASRAAPVGVATGEETLLQCTALLAGVRQQAKEPSQQNTTRAGGMKDRTSLANSGASHFSELIEQIQRVARPSRWTSSNDTRHMGMQRRMVRVRGDFDDRPVATFLGPSACLATNWKPLSWRLGQVAQEAEEAFHAGSYLHHYEQSGLERQVFLQAFDDIRSVVLNYDDC